MTFRLGFRTSGLRAWPHEAALDLLCRCGAGEIELCLEHPATPARPWTRAHRRRVRGQLADRGLNLRCVSYHGKRDEPLTKTRRTRALVQLTAQLGADVALIAPPLAHRGWEPKRFADLCRDMCQLAADHGVVLAVEPEPDTIVHGVPDMQALLAAVPSPALGVGLDLGHAFLTEGSAVAALEALGDRVVHTHWDDMARGRHLHLPPGAGEADLVPAARWLLARGYPGPWVVDLFQLEPWPEPIVRAGLEGLRAVLQEAAG